MDSLTPTETALLQAYRRCKDVDRRAVLLFADACARENPRGSMLKLAYSAPTNPQAHFIQQGQS